MKKILLIAAATFVKSHAAFANCYMPHDISSGNADDSIRKINEYKECEINQKSWIEGKWFCYIKNAVGMDSFGKSGYAGKYNSVNERFFIKINQKNRQESQLYCKSDFGLHNETMGFVNPCLANFVLQLSEDAPINAKLESIDGVIFQSSWQVTLHLYNIHVQYEDVDKDTRNFDLISRIGGNWVYTGRCEKIK